MSDGEIDVRNGVLSTAKATLQLWSNEIDKANGDEWYMHDARQAYHDVMNQMVRFKLIDEFDVQKIRVKMLGRWYE